MYRWQGNTATLTRDELVSAGVSITSLRQASRKRELRFVNRRRDGFSLIDVHSISDRKILEKIEATYGRIESIEEKQDRIMEELAELRALNKTLASAVKALLERPVAVVGTTGTIGTVAMPERPAVWPESPVFLPAVRTWLLDNRGANEKLNMKALQRLLNRIAILERCALKLETMRDARGAHGTKIRMIEEFYPSAHAYYREMASQYPCEAISNTQSFSRLFGRFMQCRKSGDWGGMVHGNKGNAHAKRVNETVEALIVSLWNDSDKPFTMGQAGVSRIYADWLAGTEELVDKETGEVFNPESFRHKGKALELSDQRIWQILKKHGAVAATKQNRDGSFDKRNNFDPAHAREHGDYSLSMITMDDYVLSRKSEKGWVTGYIYTDQVSGYTFKPAYCVGAPTIALITESHRNMVRELMELGLPKPYEASNESHLIKDIPWWPAFWDECTMNKTARGKQAEHNNRRAKYGVRKKNGHVELRFYGYKHFKGVKVKEQGEITRKTYSYQQLVEEDLTDFQEQNNQLHPDQKKFPGMTRRDVLLQHVNPKCSPFNPAYHFPMFGQSDQTTVRLNNQLRANNQVFWLNNPNMLDLLAPNNNKVTACWLAPEAGGNTDRVYVYQGDNYIGEAFDIAGKRYNECKAEQTDEDRANFEFQCRHIAKYRKWEREKKDRLPKVLRIKASAAKAIGKTLEEESPSYIVEEPVRLDNAINIDLATVQEDYSDMEERAKNY